MSICREPFRRQKMEMPKQELKIWQSTKPLIPEIEVQYINAFSWFVPEMESIFRRKEFNMLWLSTKRRNCHFDSTTFRLPWVHSIYCPSMNFFLFFRCQMEGYYPHELILGYEVCQMKGTLTYTGKCLRTRPTQNWPWKNPINLAFREFDHCTVLLVIR